MPKDGYLGSLVEEADIELDNAMSAVDSAGRIHGIEPEDVAYSYRQIDFAITLRDILKRRYDQSGGATD